MILKDLYELAKKRKRKSQGAKVAKIFAIGLGVVGAGIGMLFIAKQLKRRKDMEREKLSMLEKIKETIEVEAETIKESARDVQEEVGKAMKDVHATAKNIKEDMKGGLHETKKEIVKTVKKVSKELDKL